MWFGVDDCGLVALNLVSVAANVVSSPWVESLNVVEKSAMIAVRPSDDCSSLHVGGRSGNWPSYRDRTLAHTKRRRVHFLDHRLRDTSPHLQLSNASKLQSPARFHGTGTAKIGLMRESRRPKPPPDFRRPKKITGSSQMAKYRFVLVSLGLVGVCALIGYGAIYRSPDEGGHGARIGSTLESKNANEPRNRQRTSAEGNVRLSVAADYDQAVPADPVADAKDDPSSIKLELRRLLLDGRFD